MKSLLLPAAAAALLLSACASAPEPDGPAAYGLTQAQYDAISDTINDDIDADRDGMFGGGYLPRVKPSAPAEGAE
jgi:hypothetical protein